MHVIPKGGIKLGHLKVWTSVFRTINNKQFNRRREGKVQVEISPSD